MARRFQLPGRCPHCETMAQRMTESEIAWAAGLFEGEGNIQFWRHPKGHAQIRLSLTSTDEDVVERFHAIVECGSTRGPYRRKNKPSYKPYWVWSVQAFAELERVATLFEPWLGARRRQSLQEAIEQWHARPPARKTGPKPGGKVLKGQLSLR